MAVVAAAVVSSQCIESGAQGPPPDDDGFGLDFDPLAPQQPAAPAAQIPNAATVAANGAADAANIDGCQVIARIDGMIVQACEVLWHVNKLIEQNADKVSPEQVPKLRQELVRRELASLLDRKLLYNDFVRSNPQVAENLPHIEEKLLQPFQEQELPQLM